jgi:RNA polymerase sigma-54 factor
MKQGLSLRTSQHLALTPQLQQSIRLLQLSTLELSSEVEQMLDDNPFLEREQEEAPREEFGVAQADTPTRDDDYVAPVSVADTSSDTEDNYESSALDDLSTSWDGDGSVDMAPNDSEWGGDAPARGQDEDTADATELARSQESLTAYLHRQALGLRLSPLEAQVLNFLIESLNDDGYLEDKLEDLALGLVTGRGASASDIADLSEQQQEQLEALSDHFATVSYTHLRAHETG